MARQVNKYVVFGGLAILVYLIYKMWKDTAQQSQAARRSVTGDAPTYVRTVTQTQGASSPGNYSPGSRRSGGQPTATDPTQPTGGEVSGSRRGSGSTTTGSSTTQPKQPSVNDNTTGSRRDQVEQTNTTGTTARPQTETPAEETASRQTSEGRRQQIIEANAPPVERTVTERPTTRPAPVKPVVERTVTESSRQRAETGETAIRGIAGSTEQRTTVRTATRR